MTVSVVIPVLNGGRHLGRALSALAASRPHPAEIIVVDDGSVDDSAAVAQAAGARVLRVADGPRGPAAARNLGVRESSGELVCFVDADTAVHPDAVRRLMDTLAAHPECAAVFGSYDAAPDHPGLVSQYRNLLHHFVHQRARRDAVTFWAGCGLVRRSVFLAVGGFDERYRRASIEDIEFGGRLRAAGHGIRLCPEAQTTHLKAWTLRDVVWSDVRDRAVPWTQLILQQGRLPRDLNLDLGSRLSAGAAWVAVLSLPFAAALPWARWLAAAALGTIVLVNAPLYVFFLRLRGLRFALAGAALHGLYLLYSSAVFASLSARHRLTIAR